MRGVEMEKEEGQGNIELETPSCSYPNVAVKYLRLSNEITERSQGMLKRFSTQNFRGFAEKITFDLTARDYAFNRHLIKNGIVNKGLILGPNGAGKTNLGVAIFDMARHLSNAKKMDQRYVEPFKNFAHPNEPIIFEYTFRFGKDEIFYSYKKDGLNSLLEEHLSVNGKPYLDYDYLDESKRLFAKVLHLPRFLALNDNQVSIIKYIYENTSDDVNKPLRNLVDFAKNMLWLRCSQFNFDYAGYTSEDWTLASLIQKTNSLKGLQKFLKSFGLVYRLELKTINGKSEIYAKLPNSRKSVPFASIASAGTITLANYYAFDCLSFEDISFLFIDEFDISLHFDNAEWLLEAFFADEQYQGFFITYNTALLDNFKLRPDCAYNTVKGRISSFCAAAKRELREGNNLEKLYQAGSFRMVP